MTKTHQYLFLGLFNTSILLFLQQQQCSTPSYRQISTTLNKDIQNAVVTFWILINQDIRKEGKEQLLVGKIFDYLNWLNLAYLLKYIYIDVNFSLLILGLPTIIEQRLRTMKCTVVSIFAMAFICSLTGFSVEYFPFRYFVRKGKIFCEQNSHCPYIPINN